jgi:hypothetical protein
MGIVEPAYVANLGAAIPDLPMHLDAARHSLYFESIAFLLAEEEISGSI